MMRKQKVQYSIIIFSFRTALAVKAASSWQVWCYQYFHSLTSWPRLNREGHCHRYLEIGSERVRGAISVCNKILWVTQTQ